MSFFLIFLLSALAAPWPVAAASRGHFDVVYTWSADLEALLDYQEELESLLGPEVAKKLRFVGKGDQFGIIYDRDGSAHSSARVAVRHSEILRKAGLRQAAAIDERQYYELYNVCYGLGPNLDALEKQYALIYRYLGREVGKDLFIEKTGADNYVLIYRRRGDKSSTMRVARRHGKILKKKRITASITREENNEVIRGESSHLDRQQEREDIAAAPQTKAAAPAPKKRQQVVLRPEARKLPVAGERDSSLEREIESYIKGLRRKGKILPDEQTAWLVYDLTRDRNLVDINADHSLQAASMIKPFVALAFFLKVKEGELVYGPKSRRKMEAMIQKSDNAATNWLMRYIGGPSEVQKTLKQHYGKMVASTQIVEYIPPGGRTYRNRAAPYDYGEFLRSLWRKKLSGGQEIRRLMALPGRDRLYCGTPIPQGTLVYNKTGTTAHLCGDMGILSLKGRDGKRYPYSIVGVIEKKKRPNNYSSWKIARSNVIRKVSGIVYSALKKEYNLL